jgi:hypothetical protein
MLTMAAGMAGGILIGVCLERIVWLLRRPNHSSSK